MDFLAYPVSIVMKFWHWVLGFVVDPDSGLAWAGSVVLIVVTVRLLLLRSMWRQQYSMRKMSQLAPHMKELQARYKDDKSPEARQKQAEEMQKLYSDAGVNPVAGCLPMLVQIPVFLGLYHVLINFTPRGKTIEEAATMSNGAFGPEQVSSFLHAQVFGVPLSAYIRMPQEVIDSLHPGLERSSILALAIPLFVLAGLATFVNMWNSFRRQKAAKRAEQEAMARAEAEERAGGPVVDGEVLEVDGQEVSGPATGASGAGESGAGASGAKAVGAKDGQPEVPNFAEALQDSMNQSMKIMMYLFPIFPIAGAVFANFPIAIGLYWLTNNIWTAVQSHLFMERLEKELPMHSSEGLPPSAFM